MFLSKKGDEPRAHPLFFKKIQKLLMQQQLFHTIIFDQEVNLFVQNIIGKSASL
tara:strand:- start:239 stop:400 length:162 start_codon:yes stop_codon:yes gene_type:complete